MAFLSTGQDNNTGTLNSAFIVLMVVAMLGFAIAASLAG